MKFQKQNRQVKRLGKNQTKSTRLALKQWANEQNKKLAKRKDLSENVKKALLKSNDTIKNLCKY